MRRAEKEAVATLAGLLWLIATAAVTGGVMINHGRADGLMAGGIMLAMLAIAIGSSALAGYDE